MYLTRTEGGFEERLPPRTTRGERRVDAPDSMGKAGLDALFEKKQGVLAS
jgi:hypothetical protein